MLESGFNCGLWQRQVGSLDVLGKGLLKELVKGPGEVLLKMLNALLGAYSSRDTILGWALIPPDGAEPVSSDKAGPERESIPATLLQEDGCTVIAMVGGTGDTP